MPTYGYHCSRCQTEFEVFQRMTDEPAADCPTCGTAGRRLFYPAGIVFKGSGFYKTDSRARSSASTAGEKKAEPAKSGDGASSASPSGDTAKSGSPPKTGGTEKKATTSSAATAEA